jgi:hypothetical protein
MEVNGKGGHGMKEVGGLVRRRVVSRLKGEVEKIGVKGGAKKTCCQKKKM